RASVTGVTPPIYTRVLPPDFPVSPPLSGGYTENEPKGDPVTPAISTRYVSTNGIPPPTPGIDPGGRGANGTAPPCALCGGTARWDDHGTLRCAACYPLKGA